MKREQIEALVGNPQDPQSAETAARVYAEPSLWTTFERALYPNAEPTDEEWRTIRRFVSDRCGEASHRRQTKLHDLVAYRLERISDGMRDFALAAAPGGMRTAASDSDETRSDASEPVTFVFVSDPSDGLSDRSCAWRAEMTLPGDAAVDEMLSIVVSDGFGEPVAGGVFKVAGVALPVVRGRAEIPYGMFLSGLKDARVELIDAAGVRSHGALALF